MALSAARLNVDTPKAAMSTRAGTTTISSRSLGLLLSSTFSSPAAATSRGSST